MVTSTQDVTKSREQSRATLTVDQRQVKAAEDMADALEAIRIELTGLSIMLGRVLPTLGQGLKK